MQTQGTSNIAESAEKKDEGAKHTPGPWTISGNPASDGAFDISAEGGKLVLCSRFKWSFREVESAANARLIAAAPEMFELLREVIDPACSHVCINADFDGRTRALLARIEGRA